MKMIEFRTKAGVVRKTLEEALADNERLRVAKFIELAMTDDKILDILKIYGDPAICVAMREWNYLLERNALPLAARENMNSAPPNRRMAHLRSLLMGMENVSLDPKLYGFLKFDVYVLCDIFQKAVTEEASHE